MTGWELLASEDLGVALLGHKQRLQWFRFRV